MAVAPVRATSVLYAAGPKSGFQLGSVNFLAKPSYSPLRQLAKFFLFSSFAAVS